MSRRNILILSLIFVVVILYIANKFIPIQDCLNCRNDIKAKYPYSVVSMQDSYEQDCKKEYKQGVTFPLIKPAYALLHFDELLAFPKKLSQDEMQTILNLLNDSSSYVWGEFGTAYYDRFITFHDSTGQYIGITNIDFGGQVNSYPHLARMKWGMLTDNAYRTLMSRLK